MMEGYFLHGRNFPAHIFKKEFTRKNGRKELENFLRLYRQNFINYSDIKRIKAMGANCVRVPFNYRLIHQEQRWDYLDKVIKWCSRVGIWCILDLHAAPGGQNVDWHSDSDVRALFWKQKKNQRLFFNIWRRIADRYKNEPAIAGYDVLNEAVTKGSKTLSRIYQQVTKEIRKVDNNHIIFLEANHYGQQLRFLGKPKDKNTAYSIHVYRPINFTFNFRPHLRYPGLIDGQHWDARRVHEMIVPYCQLAERWQVPIFVGEFGINYRSPKDYGELRYLQDVLSCFQKFGFHWTYWAYKAVAGPVQPDGIFQYLPISAWVKREGPIMGWENFYSLWKAHKAQISSSWKTEKFTENKYISRLLSRYF
ncbi:MAG: cellulase family glycosylhydrolase [Candidatus Omnitrophica bacterium]|nr:cellulase family glycosylhydrolase [Candidatus Omnitrophota bacterium]